MEKFVFALALAGIVDSISFMVVAPSISFYVLGNGGTKEQYGIILSAFSFASFCAKPVLGMWSDKKGFRIPYLVTLTISAIGGVLYLLANSFSSPSVAVGAIFVGRLLGGVGAANSALGFAYMAQAVPHEKQTQTSALLSMMRMVGMVAGPAVNIFLVDVDFYIGKLHVNGLNSVGLVLIGSNLLAMASIYFLLDEVEHISESRELSISKGSLTVTSKWGIFKAMLSPRILVPALSIFALNANFQLVETALAPAASHALGWGPVKTSYVLGSISIVVFVNMMIVFQLSARKVRDESLLIFGLVLSIGGYMFIYFLWVEGTTAWLFTLPIIVSISCFPFLGAPSRSIYTQAVNANSVLGSNHHGMTQALLSMVASVAGFTAPGFVAYFCLRDPDEVEASVHHQELSAWALFAPILSLLTLVGILCIGNAPVVAMTMALDDENPEVPVTLANEATTLLDDKIENTSTTPRRFSHREESDRRNSVMIMGFSQRSLMSEE